MFNCPGGAGDQSMCQHMPIFVRLSVLLTLYPDKRNVCATCGYICAYLMLFSLSLQVVHSCMSTHSFAHLMLAERGEHIRSTIRLQEPPVEAGICFCGECTLRGGESRTGRNRFFSRTGVDQQNDTLCDADVSWCSM